MRLENRLINTSLFDSQTTTSKLFQKHIASSRPRRYKPMTRKISRPFLPKIPKALNKCPKAKGKTGSLIYLDFLNSPSNSPKTPYNMTLFALATYLSRCSGRESRDIKPFQSIGCCCCCCFCCSTHMRSQTPDPLTRDPSHPEHPKK